MYFEFNSWDLFYKKPFGAMPVDEEVLIRVKAYDVYNIRLRTHYQSTDKFFPLEPIGDGIYEVRVKMPVEAHVLWYNFVFEAEGKTYYYGTQDDTLGGRGQIYHQDVLSSYQITLYDPVYGDLPDWYADGIMYQIFPDRFNKGDYPGFIPKYPDRSLIHGHWEDSPHYFRSAGGDIEYWDFFGGNLAGIIDKLDYLVSLGITIIYLNPVFESSSNHKYDTGDYMNISPDFGTEEIFKELCTEAKKRGIRIILDGVFSHTGDNSRYFNKYGKYDSVGAYQSENSPYYRWYRFEHFPDEYESWWGVKSMPNVEELTPSYQKFIYEDKDSVIRHWLKAGASGWRLDVADELPDEFIMGIKSAMMAEKSDSILIGEVWEDASRKIAYGLLRKYFSGLELDAVMNYPFRDAFLQFMLGYKSSSDTARLMMSLYENYPRSSFQGSMNLIGSHDRMRVLSILGKAPRELPEEAMENYRLSAADYDLAKRRLKVLSLIQMTFPGVPCIYYGDEAGVQGYRDPYNRSTYPWGHEDEDLLSWYKQITALRGKHMAFSRGDWYPMKTQDHLMYYIRDDGSKSFLCFFNRSVDDTIVYQNPTLAGRQGKELITETIANLDKITLAPLSAKVILLLGERLDESELRLNFEDQAYHI